MDIQQQLMKYIDLALRWKKFIIFCLLVSAAVGMGQYLRTGKIYQASALIMFQPQKINPAKMSPDSKSQRMAETIHTIGQQITSRTSLEQLIEKFDLYPEMRKKYPMEIVVANMRGKDIHINPSQRGNNFEVLYQGSSPQKVMLVTNELAAKFIEENLRDREARASETSAYTQNELEMAKERLDKKEQMMRDYKLQYYNEMPERLNINMSRLNSLQSQYQNNQTNLQQLEQTRVLAQEQINLREKLASQQQVLSGYLQTEPGGSRQARVESPAEEIARLRLELKGLRSKYTEKHPEVKRVMRKLEDLEAAQAEPAGTVKNQKAGSRITLIDPQLEQLKRQLKETDFSIQSLKEEKDEIKKQITQYQKWVAAAPVREAEWNALTRDYDQLNQNYQELVRRNLEAGAAESLERSQKGSRFKIVDPARFPEKPIKPDFKKIMLLALFLGLGVGGGIAFAVDSFDSSFRDVGELEEFLGIKVTCTVPFIYTRKEKILKAVKNSIWIVVLLSFASALTIAAAWLWQKGIIII